MEHDLRSAGRPRHLVRGLELSRVHDALWARAYELLLPVPRRPARRGTRRDAARLGKAARRRPLPQTIGG
jgi:hypothetical protein